MLYCIAAPGVPRKVVAALTRHFEGEPEMVVIEDRRVAERRLVDRRGLAPARSRIWDRRRVRGGAGLRVADRRTVLGPVFGEVVLPRIARGHAEALTFGARVGRSQDIEDDIAAARLALAHQGGETPAFQALYDLWFDRAFTYFRTVRAASEEVEEAVNDLFGLAFARLEGFEPDHVSYRAWLAGMATELGTRWPQEAEELSDRMLERWNAPADPDALALLNDDELIVLMRHLPGVQHHVVALRYVLGLTDRELARVLDLEEEEIPDQHERALRLMSGCLSSLSRRPGFSGRLPMRERRRYYPVTAGRKRALVA